LLLKHVTLLNCYTACCRAETEEEDIAALTTFCEMLCSKPYNDFFMSKLS